MPVEEPPIEVAMSEPAPEPTPEPVDHQVMPLAGESGAARISPVRIGLILLTLLGIFSMGAVSILNYAENLEPEPVMPVVVRR